MQCCIKSVLVASTLGITCAARAAGLADMDDPSAREAYIAQARQQQVAQPHERDGQGKSAEPPASASAQTNQQILAQLIGINTTLQQLLELERSNASTASR